MYGTPTERTKVKKANVLSCQLPFARPTKEHPQKNTGS